MSDYKYTSAYKKIPEILGKIVTTGRPTKVTKEWLETLGYRSSNDRPLIGVLKFIGFADEPGNPTELWQAYKGGNRKQVLGTSIRAAYNELFELYEDAYQRSGTELENFFRPRTTGGDEVVRQTIETFKALCSQADFSASLNGDAPTPPQPTNGRNSDENGEEAQSSALRTTQASNEVDVAPSVHIDIQIHISPESSPEQIDQIFASMAKHLYKKRGE